MASTEEEDLGTAEMASCHSHLSCSYIRIYRQDRGNKRASSHGRKGAVHNTSEWCINMPPRWTIYL